MPGSALSWSAVAELMSTSLAAVADFAVCEAAGFAVGAWATTAGARLMRVRTARLSSAAFIRFIDMGSSSWNCNATFSLTHRRWAAFLAGARAVAHEFYRAAAHNHLVGSFDLSKRIRDALRIDDLAPRVSAG